MGQSVAATVIGKLDYGMLVELNTGVVALLHRRDIDWTSADPMQLLHIGDALKVKVLSVDPERQRMRVSRRALLPNPQDAFVRTTQAGAVYAGTIAKCMGFGAFVELAPGVRGLLHISEMRGHGEDLSACTPCAPGDRIRVRVIGIDPESKHISLSLEPGSDPR